MNMKDSILLCAVERAKHVGLMHFTREHVASVAGCSEANVSYHFGSMVKMRTAVVEFAIEREVIEILVQARALRHPALHGRLTAALKERVANLITR